MRISNVDSQSDEQDLVTLSLQAITWHNLHALMKILMDIMWPESQSDFHLSFIFIEMNFYSLSFLCDVCNEVHEHMQ